MFNIADIDDMKSVASNIGMVTDDRDVLRKLLAEIQSDPMLRNYSVLILDEAHERSLNIDFLLGYVKRLLERRKDLKLVISSATLDAGATQVDIPLSSCETSGYSWEYVPSR